MKESKPLPTARELVGLIESFIQGEIEMKFAYFLDHDDILRQYRAQEHLDVIKAELVKRLTDRIDLLTESKHE